MRKICRIVERSIPDSSADSRVVSTASRGVTPALPAEAGSKVSGGGRRGLLPLSDHGHSLMSRHALTLGCDPVLAINSSHRAVRRVCVVSVQQNHSAVDDPRFGAKVGGLSRGGTPKSMCETPGDVAQSAQTFTSLRASRSSSRSGVRVTWARAACATFTVARHRFAAMPSATQWQSWSCIPEPTGPCPLIRWFWELVRLTGVRTVRVANLAGPEDFYCARGRLTRARATAQCG